MPIAELVLSSSPVAAAAPLSSAGSCVPAHGLLSTAHVNTAQLHDNDHTYGASSIRGASEQPLQLA